MNTAQSDLHRQLRPLKARLICMTAKFVFFRSILFAGSLITGNWTVDAVAAKVSFAIKGPFGTVRGEFTGLKATIQFNEQDLAGSSITASIDPATVSTGIGLRNRHLRDEEQYLNTSNYPAISFRSKKIKRAGSRFTAEGELTLKGVTKPVEIAFTFNSSGDAGLFKGEFTFKRADFNIGKAGGSIGELITMTLEVPVKK
jgi:polyisoprenoid-binding protein YceI